MDKPGVYAICLHPLVCDALLSLLRQAGIRIVGQSSTLEQALTDIQLLQPQIVLLEGTATSAGWEEAMRSYVGQASGRCLLVLDPDRDVLGIYTRQDQTIRSGSDLVATLGAFGA